MNTTYTHIAPVLLSLLLAFAPLFPVHAGLLVGGAEQVRIDAEKAKKKASTDKSDRWLMAYYVGYQNSYLKPKDVDYSLMTHIVVGAVGVKADGTLKEHYNLPNGDGRAMAKDVRNRAHNAGVKSLIWLGGPGEEDMFLSATSDKTRAKFVKNIINLVGELGYDGVDIDWEPIRKQDEPGLLALVKDLRSADPDLLITVPINWVPSSLAKTKDLSLYKKMAPYTDRLFIMSYSMAGPWSGWRTWHGSALTGEGTYTPSSIESSVQAYLTAGVPKETLGIGIGTYATCWEYSARTPDGTLPKVYSPSKVKTMSMRTLMDDYYSKKYARWDEDAQVPYLSFSKPRGKMQCGFISYEDERSITAKMTYAKDMGLGGALLWNLGTGYFPSATKSKRHALLGATYEAL
jgi:chitinase